MRLTPTRANQQLDDMGLLDDAYESGVYALDVHVPNSADAVARRWLDTHGTPLPDRYPPQLAIAEDVVYVGAAAQTYSRIMDHARGDVRQASFLEAFPPVRVRGVWPGARSSAAERERARTIADMATCCWMDGELF